MINPHFYNDERSSGNLEQSTSHGRRNLEEGTEFFSYEKKT